MSKVSFLFPPTSFQESCALTIRLTDKNDNYPEFSSSQYETSVEEDSIKMRDHVQVEVEILELYITLDFEFIKPKASIYSRIC